MAGGRFYPLELLLPGHDPRVEVDLYPACHVIENEFSHEHHPEFCDFLSVLCPFVYAADYDIVGQCDGILCKSLLFAAHLFYIRYIFFSVFPFFDHVYPFDHHTGCPHVPECDIKDVVIFVSDIMADRGDH